MSKQRRNSKSPTVSKQIRKHSKESDSSSSERRYGKFWKPHEDTQLIELHAKYDGNWKVIADSIPGRNLSQCQQRWKRINPNKVKFQNSKRCQKKLRKQWTDEEDKRVIQLVEQYERNWKLIEGFMEGRSSKQIRERFLNNLDPEINRQKFTAQEDKIIMEQYRIYGPKWSEIAKMLDRRPENQVKNRFYSYIKRVHMLEERSDDDDDDNDDNDYNSSKSEQQQPPMIPLYQPLETIQSLEHENTKNDSMRNESFINIRTPSHRIQPSINLIQAMDSFDSKQFEGGLHSQDISPFHQRRILMDYSPINFEYGQHHPTFDNVQEDVRELGSQIECMSLEKIN